MLQSIARAAGRGYDPRAVPIGVHARSVAVPRAACGARRVREDVQSNPPPRDPARESNADRDAAGDLDE